MINAKRQIRIRYAPRPHPDMSQLMGQRKQLGPYAVRGVDKNHRGQRVGNGKAAKLLHVQRTVGIMADHPVAHHQYTRRLRLANKLPQKPVGVRVIGPGSQT